MQAWWSELSSLNQGVYALASFFTVLFAWQFLAALVGFGGSDLDPGPEVDDGVTSDGIAVFKLLSIRSVIAFGMLFGWTTALYLEAGKELTIAVLYGLVWGAAGMYIIAYFFKNVQKLTETGTVSPESCVGTVGEVYIEIPANGSGQVRVVENGVVSYLNARGKMGVSIPNNARVRVVSALDGSTLEVEPVADANATEEG